MGARRADRHALDPLGRRRALPEPSATELERIIRCILEAPMRRVGLEATASYLPERVFTAAELGAPAGSPRT